MSIGLLENYIENDLLEEVKTLLTNEPKLALQATSHQLSPLLLACFYQKTEIAATIANFVPKLNIFEACALNKVEEVAELLKATPKLLDSYSDDGFTPIYLACHFNSEAVALYLLKAGADVNLPSQNGFNVFPIHAAVSSGNATLTAKLLDLGAYPNVCQRSGVSPLHTAAQMGNIEVIIALLEHGAEVRLKTEQQQTPSDLAFSKGFKEIAEILRDDD